MIKLPCPSCSRRIIDANKKIKTELFVFESKEKREGDYYIKCTGCKKVIGVIKEKIN